MGERPTLLELELEGLAEEGANPFGIQPGRGTGLADEGDGATHAKLGVEGLEVAGEAGQSVEQVSHAHQIVVALHGVDPGKVLAAPAPGALEAVLGL